MRLLSIVVNGCEFVDWEGASGHRNRLVLGQLPSVYNLACFASSFQSPSLIARCEKAPLRLSSARWMLWNSELDYPILYHSPFPVPQTARSLFRPHLPAPDTTASYAPLYCLFSRLTDKQVHRVKGGKKGVAEDGKRKEEGVVIHDRSHIQQMQNTVMNRDL